MGDYEALGGEVTEPKITENDLRGVEEVKRATEVAAEEESLSLHIDVGRVVGESGDFIGEEDGGGVQVFADAVANHASDLLDFFFSHCLIGKVLRLHSLSLSH